MPNRVWQAEEEKWERRRLRAEKALTHIRQLRQLEAEEEAEDQAKDSAGQATAAAVQPVAAAGPITAVIPPRKNGVELAVGESPTANPEPKRPAKEAIPDLLKERGPLTTNAMATALSVSPQAVMNAVDPLMKQGIVIREASSVPGFKYQFRWATSEERLQARGGHADLFEDIQRMKEEEKS